MTSIRVARAAPEPFVRRAPTCLSGSRRTNAQQEECDVCRTDNDRVMLDGYLKPALMNPGATGSDKGQVGSATVRCPVPAALPPPGSTRSDVTKGRKMTAESGRAHEATVQG